MEFIITENPTDSQKLDIITLWNREYPQAFFLNRPEDFEEYLSGLLNKEHVLLCDEDGFVKGWLLCFDRDGDRCFALILDSSLQGQGWGSKFLNLAKERNTSLNGWVIANDDQIKCDGSLYKSPLEFYVKNKFAVRQDHKKTMKSIEGVVVQWFAK